MKKNTYLIIDFDSTFVQGETLEELALLALSGNAKKDMLLARMKKITKEGMEGRIPYEDSLSQRLSLFSANKRHINLYVKQLKKKVTKSVYRNKHLFKANKDMLYIVSGGFIDYIWPIVKEFGIKKTHVLANRFIYGPNGTVTGYDQSIALCRKGGKAQVVRGLNLFGTVTVVGDGFTDYEIREAGAANKFVVFIENIRRENIVSLADSVAPNFDHIFANL